MGIVRLLREEFIDEQDLGAGEPSHWPTELVALLLVNGGDILLGVTNGETRSEGEAGAAGQSGGVGRPRAGSNGDREHKEDGAHHGWPRLQ